MSRLGSLQSPDRTRKARRPHFLLDARQDGVRYSLSPRDIPHVHALDLGKAGEQRDASANGARASLSTNQNIVLLFGSGAISAKLFAEIARSEKRLRNLRAYA